MNKILLILVVMLGMVLLSHAFVDKLWIMHQSAESTNGSAGAEVWFIQDKETGTRCYAFRANAHEGAAISCVKQ